MSEVQLRRMQRGDVWPGRRPVTHLLAEALALIATGRGAEPVLLSGPRGSGRTEALAWLATRIHHDGLLSVRGDAAAGTPPAAAVLRSIADAGELLVGRRPGSSAVQSLRRRSAALATAAGDGRAVPVGELPALVRLLGEATEEARAALVLVITGLAGDGPARELLDAVQRGHDPNQPVLVVAACQVLRGAPEGWRRVDLGPLGAADLDAALQDPGLLVLGPVLTPARATAVLERTGGWPGLLTPVLEHLAAAVRSAAAPLDDEAVTRAVAETVAATVQRWIGGPLSSPERRYLRAVVDLAGADGSASLVDVGRALGDSTRFSAESSTLAQLRLGLLERGALFSPGKDRLAPALVGLGELLR
ncbi:MAG: hypothetical protein AB7O92_11905 [Acidimicrobiia bacterium]